MLRRKHLHRLPLSGLLVQTAERPAKMAFGHELCHGNRFFIVVLRMLTSLSWRAMINAYNPQFSALDCSRMTEGDLRSQWRRPLRQSPYCETRANLRSGRPLGNAADNAKVRQYLHPFDHTCFNDLGRNYLDGAYPQANSQASTSQPPAFTAAPNTTATPQVSLPRSDSHTQPGVFSHDPSLSLHQKQPIAGPATGQYVIQAGAAGQENVWGASIKHTSRNTVISGTAGTALGEGHTQYQAMNPANPSRTLGITGGTTARGDASASI